MSSRLFAGARGFAYAGCFVWLWWRLLGIARPLDPRLPLSLPAAWRPVGIAVAVAGGSLTLACVISFAVVGVGTPAPFDAPRRFVASGPYRWVRNPMYLGALLVLFGVALALRAPSALLVAAGFFLLAHLFVIGYEEPTLEARFGDDYRRYRAEVNRWLPRPSREGTGD